MSVSVTMKDVAREAGVSLSTVSKVLNGTGNVDSELCDRVRGAANKLGYRRNYIARLLKTSKTNHVHIILPNVSDQNFRNVYAGAEQVLNDRGYLVSLHLTSEIRYRENLFLEAAAQQLAAGVIIATCQPDEGTRARELDSGGAKIVFIEREPAHGRYSYLDFDNRRLIRAAVGNAIADGRRRPVLLAGPREYSSEFQAALGFRDALSGAEGGGIEGAVIEANLDPEGAFLAMVNHLHAGARPDLIVTTSMIAHKSARKAVELLEPGTPGAIRFLTLGYAGWADSILGDTEIIPRNGYRMGEEAARVLVANMEGSAADDVRYYRVEAPEPRPGGGGIPRPRVGSGGTLRLLLQSNSIPSIRPLLADFTKRLGCRVEIDAFFYDDMFDVFENPEKIERYDIFQIDQPIVTELSAAGALERLDGLLERLPELPDIGGGHPNTAIDVYSRYRGGVYAIPFRFGAQLMFYRSDLFDSPEMRMRYRQATGRELHPPRTWEEFNSVARFFTRAHTPDSPVEFGASMGSHHYIGAVSEFIPRLWAFGGSALDVDGGLALESRQALDALRNYVESQRYSSPDGARRWLDGQIRDFNAGRSAMMIIFSAMAEHLVQRGESRVVGKIAFAHQPGGTPLLGGWSLGIRKGSPNREMAAEWIRWLTSDRMAMPHTVLGGGNIAAMSRENSELRVIYPWLSMALESFRMSRPHEVSSVSTNGGTGFRLFAMALSQCIHETIRGEIPAGEALAKAVRLIRLGREGGELRMDLVDDAAMMSQ